MNITFHVLAKFSIKKRGIAGKNSGDITIGRWFKSNFMARMSMTGD
jgi:hypothetical protein